MVYRSESLDDFRINFWMIFRFLMLLVYLSVWKFRFFVRSEAILISKLFFRNAKDVKHKSHCYECHQDEEIRRGNRSCQFVRVGFPIYLVLVIQDVYFVNFVLQFITIPEYKAFNYSRDRLVSKNESLFDNRCEQAIEPNCIMLTVSSTGFNIKNTLRTTFAIKSKSFKIKAEFKVKQLYSSPSTSIKNQPVL